MSNIVKFPSNHFTKMHDMQENQSLNAHKYLRECKDTLDEGDYVDVLCGIMDPEYYDILDRDLQEIVETYYSHLI